MLKELISQGESEILEFKRELPKKDLNFLKTIVAFLKMKIVEKWGTGIQRVAALCKQYGLDEVKYDVSDDFL